MINIGIVAHKKRAAAALELADKVRAQKISLDSMGLGGLRNHTAMWQWHLEHPAQWCVVLEDDALPVDGFRYQLQKALAEAPAPIVSLYLGTGYISDHTTKLRIEKAEQVGAHWLVAHGSIWHAVGLAVRLPLLPMMVKHLRSSSRPVDSSLSTWARRSGLKVAYAVPSLVDHADGESLICRYRRAPRHAFRVGGHEEWNAQSIALI